MNATLVAHCGTSRVSEAVVMAEPRPDFTASWHPFSHAEVIDAVGQAVAAAGFSIERKEYSISPGASMFGVWEVNKQDDELRYAIGIRNSINKTMSVGLCAGERVFVCDNMVFSSDYVLFRKHTGLLDAEELSFMAKEALTCVIGRWERLRAWHDSMKSIELTTSQASVMVVAAMRRGIIPPSNYVEWDRLFYGDDEGASKYTPTLHGWHGATTELMNGLALHMSAYKQTKLNEFIDHEAPLLLSAAASKKFYTFGSVEKKAAKVAEKAKDEKKAEARALAVGFREKVKFTRRVKKVLAASEKKAGR